MIAACAGWQYNNSAWVCMQQMYRQEGLGSLYRGIYAPMLTYGALGSIIFGSYATSLRFLSDNADVPSLWHVSLAGMIAGVVSAVPTGPIELLKCRAQAKLTPEQARIELNPVTCARHIVRTKGARGLFLGVNATVLRDTPGVGMYFLVYEWLCRRWGVHDTAPANTMDLNTFAKLNLAGGLAGTAAWVSYPLDVIKTRLQTQSLTHPIYSGVVDCARKIVAAEGPAVLLRGLTATIIQAFPVSAVTFATYEIVLMLLRSPDAVGGARRHP